MEISGKIKTEKISLILIESIVLYSVVFSQKLITKSLMSVPDKVEIKKMIIVDAKEG